MGPMVEFTEHERAAQKKQKQQEENLRLQKKHTPTSKKEPSPMGPGERFRAHQAELDSSRGDRFAIHDDDDVSPNVKSELRSSGGTPANMGASSCVATPMSVGTSLPTATPLSQFKAVALDMTGDGVPDTLGFDTTGDGQIDHLAPTTGRPIDLTGDGKVVAIGHDTTGD